MKNKHNISILFTSFESHRDKRYILLDILRRELVSGLEYNDFYYDIDNIIDYMKLNCKLFNIHNKEYIEFESCFDNLLCRGILLFDVSKKTKNYQQSTTMIYNDNTAFKFDNLMFNGIIRGKKNIYNDIDNINISCIEFVDYIIDYVFDKHFMQRNYIFKRVFSVYKLYVFVFNNTDKCFFNHDLCTEIMINVDIDFGLAWHKWINTYGINRKSIDCADIDISTYNIIMDIYEDAKSCDMVIEIKLLYMNDNSNDNHKKNPNHLKSITLCNKSDTDFYEIVNDIFRKTGGNTEYIKYSNNTITFSVSKIYNNYISYILNQYTNTSDDDFHESKLYILEQKILKLKNENKIIRGKYNEMCNTYNETLAKLCYYKDILKYMKINES